MRILTRLCRRARRNTALAVSIRSVPLRCLLPVGTKSGISSRDLHLDAQGRQMLMIFRYSRLMPMDKGELEQVRQLWRKHPLLFRLPEKAPLASLTRQEMHAAGGEEQ